VLAGLGQVALARQQYAQAVAYLEEVLSIDPAASSVHSPLALAYRGLGDIEKAEAHLAQWSDRDVLVPDPLRMELDLALESGLSYELRGIRAFEKQDWTSAAEFFRRGLELTADDADLKRSLRHKLGTALYLGGDPRGAVEQFEEVIRLAPAEGLDESASRAYYSVAVLMASNGRDEEAIEHFLGAVKYGPNYLEALRGLADALRRAGRAGESLPYYQRVIELSPQSADAKFGYAMGLVRVGRYREAYDRVREARVAHPQFDVFTLAEARLLAAAPDDSVRDGERAMRLVQQLLQGERTLELGETLAMALAELGDYRSAADTQRDVVASAERAGLPDVARRMSDNLRLYESGRPCRTPWRNDDPVHRPGAPVDPDLRGLP
jgi:tetratricopeptide (TPR) repeat protein